MSRYMLKSNSPSAMREVVELVHATAVAPKLLRECGWHSFEYPFSDEDVASIVSSARIKPGKWFTYKQVLRICSAIDATVSVAFCMPLLMEQGLVRCSTTEIGESAWSLTEVGSTHWLASPLDKNLS